LDAEPIRSVIERLHRTGKLDQRFRNSNHIKQPYRA
jgi:hypothetical protein